MQEKPPNKFTPSPGLAAWLEGAGLSFAFTSYDSGMLYLVGQKRGDIGLCFRKFGRTMGLAYRNETLYLASDGQIFELENDGSGGDQYDAVFMPRRTNLIQRCDAHELKVSEKGEVYFANTAYSCISKLHPRKSFEISWQPEFISQTVPEDRCHLNGIDLREDGNLLVSMCNQSDTLEGWRSNRANGGFIHDVQRGCVADRISMPHSPRFYDDSIAFLDSGRGFLQAGNKRIFCPGFLRGLAITGDYALVTVSLPREGLFHGLELEDNLAKRGGEAWCGVLVVNLETAAIEHSLRIEGEIRELFDVAAMPGIKNPTLFGPGDPTLMNRASYARPNN